jgi:hypothetical protein
MQFTLYSWTTKLDAVSVSKTDREPCRVCNVLHTYNSLRMICLMMELY